ncbi:ABC transporter ATP-binding protein [Sphingomonas sp.]|uniref:ABC transporter ATP-binding protein n=1 Tax=Sphingomonas sp. TaxID=28214 RepID=UPI0025E3E828|nr:ABC transporter ATP-binding protein [Sphingomonas sp.]
MTETLTIRNLSVTLHTRRGRVEALDDVSLSIGAGETLGLVGESGSGKSVLARIIMRLLATGGLIETEGTVLLDGKNVLALPEKNLRHLRGRRMAMIFQDPMSSLNPTMRIGEQIAEGIRLHLGTSRAEARESASRMLASVGIADPKAQLDRYPSHLSGGMRQRVAIAIALACQPDILIADEPTTALDVTVQAQILQLLRSEQQRRGMAMLLVTHDLGVIASHADRVAVLYAGQVMEIIADARRVRQSRMPYTAALVRAQPDMRAPAHVRLEAIGGLPPQLVSPPEGCRFAQRCPRALTICSEERPPLEPGPIPGDALACWNPLPGSVAA